MSVLFHPSLGRFSGPSDAAAYGAGTGSDSDSFYARRHRSEPRPTRREEGLLQQGGPGSRRRRRYLNALGESEVDTEGEWDSDADRPIVRFEWNSTFVQAGTGFFDKQADEARRAEQGDKPRRRRVPTLRRRRAGETQQDQDVDDEDDDVVMVEGESKHAMARRIRAAKFASHSAAASTSSAGESDMTSCDDMDLAPHSALKAVGLQSVSIAESGANKKHGIVGQEHAGSLFLGIEHSVRRSLRKCKCGDTELAFLAELEALLVLYKQGRAPSLHARLFTHFDALAESAATAAPHDVDTEATSDDEDLLLVRAGPVEAPLRLIFRNSFERFLAHGLVQFHQLVSRSYTAVGSDRRITRVRTPRRGVRMHHALLVPYLERLQGKPNRR